MLLSLVAEHHLQYRELWESADQCDRGRIFSVDNQLHRGYYTSCTESFGSRLIIFRGSIFSVDNELQDITLMFMAFGAFDKFHMK